MQIAKLLIGVLILAASQTGRAAEWKLVWSDEFEKDGLPDSSKWDYEDGFIRNNEAQYYTRGRKENARIENGNLVIEGRRERFANAAHRPDARRGPATRPFAEYTSASLTTRHKHFWTYGRIEVRARLPQGKGVWPAIWMLGESWGKVPWPRCGEIDIMEFVGHTPDELHGTVHFQKERRHRSSGNKIKVEKPFADFHVYSVEWFPDRMDFFFNDRKIHTFRLEQADENSENPFRKPHFLILNLALGGTWGRQIDDRIFPQTFLIDYVRVYRDAKQESPVP